MPAVVPSVDKATPPAASAPVHRRSHDLVCVFLFMLPRIPVVIPRKTPTIVSLDSHPALSWRLCASFSLATRAFGRSLTRRFGYQVDARVIYPMSPALNSHEQLGAGLRDYRDRGRATTHDRAWSQVRGTTPSEKPRQ